jgi:5'-3' exonuclease
VADTLMLLDSASLYFRAYYGVPETVVAPDGTPVNAVRGLLDMISMLVGKYHPQRLVACMDADWRPAFRVAAVPSYKAHRVAPEGGEEVPDTLSPQVPILTAALQAIGIATLGVAGHEADDVIGTLTVRHDGPVDIVTGDRDLFQLVRDDKPVRVLYTAKGMRDLPAIDEAEVERRYGIPGRAYADFALLRGDPSDGLPGVPGVGDKTAAGILARYGSTEALLDALDQPDHPAHGGLSPSVRAKLVAARDYLVAARPVVDVVCDLPVPTDLDDLLPTAAADPAALVALSERWGLDSPLNRLLSVLGRG